MKIVILGASSGFGAEFLIQSLAAGHDVLALTRDPEAVQKLHQSPRFAAKRIGTTDRAALAAALVGADVVVFGTNVSYEHWETVMPAALGTLIEAVRAQPTAPRIVFPGNVYGLGQSVTAFTEDMPNRPTMKKGRLRARLEEMLRAAAAQGLPVLIVRGANFFGPTVRNGLVDRIYGRAAAGKPVEIIGTGKHAQQLTYVPDAVHATLALLDRGGLAPFEVVNMPTHDAPGPAAFAAEIAALAGHPELKVKLTPWTVVRILGLVVPVMRELPEVRYIQEEGVRLDATKLAAMLPGLRVTPLDQAVRATLASYRTAAAANPVAEPVPL